MDVFSPAALDIVRTMGQVDLNKEPRIVCEKQTPTGSQFTKMVCMTRKEMAIIKKESEEVLLDVQRAQESMN